MDEVINKAISFAVKKHEGQKRKGTDFPYIVHIYDVMQILQDNNAPIESIIAGILHDTVEDTNTTLNEIESIFGTNIRDMVDVLSENKNLPYTERKLLQAYRLKNASFVTKLVKCADCLSNLKAIKNELKFNPNLWNKFNSSKQNIQNHYAHTIQAMSDLERCDMYKKLRILYTQVFNFKTNQSETKKYCNDCNFIKQVPTPEPYDCFCDYDIFNNNDKKFVCGIDNRELFKADKFHEKQLTPPNCPIK